MQCIVCLRVVRSLNQCPYGCWREKERWMYVCHTCSNFLSCRSVFSVCCQCCLISSRFLRDVRLGYMCNSKRKMFKVRWTKEKKNSVAYFVVQHRVFFDFRQSKSFQWRRTTLVYTTEKMATSMERRHIWTSLKPQPYRPVLAINPSCIRSAIVPRCIWCCSLVFRYVVLQR